MQPTWRCGLTSALPSPDYALRSYLYICLHAALGQLGRLLFIEHLLGKVGVFFFIRACLAVACALCEALFVKAVSLPHNFGAHVGEELCAARVLRVLRQCPAVDRWCQAGCCLGSSP